MSLAVGLLHYTVPPIVGGVETVIGQHARLLVDAGHGVRVIAGRGGPLDRRVELVRMPLADTRHPAVRRAQRQLEAGSVPVAFERLVASLAESLLDATRDLDVLVAHNVCTLNLHLALTAALRRTTATRTRPRLVMWTHDIAAAGDGDRPPLHPGWPWDLVRAPWPGAIAVTVSRARAAELARATGIDEASVRVVPNGIDRPGFLGIGPTTRRLVDALGLAAAGPVLLTPARITPRKNLEFAIELLAELRRTDGDARLVITGPPDPHDPATRSYLARLRRLAEVSGVSGAAHFLADGPRGWRSPRVIAELYRVADALLLPSRDEGFGLPILEAAVARLPIICADIPPLRELGGDAATYVDPAGDPREAARIVRERLGRDEVQRLAWTTRRAHDWHELFVGRIEPLLVEAAEAGAGAVESIGSGEATGRAEPVGLPVSPDTSGEPPERVPA